MSITASAQHLGRRTNKVPETLFFSIVRAAVRNIFLVYLSCITSR